MLILVIILSILLVILLYMIKEAFENHLLHHEVSIWGEQERVSIFFISDVHKRKVSEKMIKQIRQPIDAVIIGGDLADQRTSLLTIKENIQLLKTLGTIYFVWGNNDREIGEEKLRELFHQERVHIIENDAILIPNIKNRCWLVATDDPSSKNVQIHQAFQKCNEKDSIIFISHNPETFSKVIKTYRPLLLLGGHYHGGQIRFGPFGLHPNGFFEKRDGIATLISNGYGTTAIPLRFGAKPQCHVIHLNFSKDYGTKS